MKRDNSNGIILRIVVLPVGSTIGGIEPESQVLPPPLSLSLETSPTLTRRSSDGAWLGANELSVSHVLKKTKRDERTRMTRSAETRESSKPEMPSTQISKLAFISFQILFSFFSTFFSFMESARAARNSSCAPCVNAFQAKIEELHREFAKVCENHTYELGCCLQFDHDFFRKEISDSLAM